MRKYKNYYPDDPGWQQWPLFNMRMPPSIKLQTESFAKRLDVFQSTIVKIALEEFFLNHAETEDELKAAEITNRRREETMKLEGAKDGHRTAMRTASVWDTIKKERIFYREAGILRPSQYRGWAKRLRENISSLSDNNPDKDIATEALANLITNLKKECCDTFKGYVWEGE